MDKNIQQSQAAIPENLTPQQALGLLIQGVNFAQSKGVYTLADAGLLLKAVSVFSNQEEPGKSETTKPVEDVAVFDQTETTKPVEDVTVFGQI